MFHERFPLSLFGENLFYLIEKFVWRYQIPQANLRIGSCDKTSEIAARLRQGCDIS
ncbi:hypothetical protein GALL_403140 [mine drainage metagenome]|uniref:Uncharacterized protein n=1 Tax=mine drainage metagenome TaxID=410659 RepID=A0A1J5Q2P8_9ZZZZ